MAVKYHNTNYLPFAIYNKPALFTSPELPSLYRYLASPRYARVADAVFRIEDACALVYRLVSNTDRVRRLSP